MIGYCKTTATNGMVKGPLHDSSKLRVVLFRLKRPSMRYVLSMTLLIITAYIWPKLKINKS
jgi:hypothetical protein